MGRRYQARLDQSHRLTERTRCSRPLAVEQKPRFSIRGRQELGIRRLFSAGACRFRLADAKDRDGDFSLMYSKDPASGSSRLMGNSHLKRRVFISAGSNTGTGRRDQILGGLPRIIRRPWFAVQL